MDISPRFDMGEICDKEALKNFLIEHAEGVLKQLGYGLRKDAYVEAMRLELSAYTDQCKSNKIFYRKFKVFDKIHNINIGTIDLMFEPRCRNAECYVQITTGDKIQDEDMIWLLRCLQQVPRVYYRRYYIVVLNFPTDPDGKVTCDGFSDRDIIPPEYDRFQI